MYRWAFNPKVGHPELEQLEVLKLHFKLSMTPQATYLQPRFLVLVLVKIGRPRRVKRAVSFEPQGLSGLDNLEEDRKVL